VVRAESELADLARVCEPCSTHFHVQAVLASARAHDLPRARRHLADAERIAGLWQGGAWPAAVWEARAAVRLGEGRPAQAAAFLDEAAQEYTRAHRPADAARCQTAGKGIAEPEPAA
jgi:hypothetical protein